jgi:hypothetical protein
MPPFVRRKSWPAATIGMPTDMKSTAAMMCVRFTSFGVGFVPSKPPFSVIESIHVRSSCDSV